VEEHLNAVVLLILNWVEAHVKFGQQFKVLNVSELKNFLDFVQGQIKEPKVLNEFKTTQVGNVVPGKVKGAQEGQVSKTRDLGELVLCQVKLLEVDLLNVFNLPDLVLVERQNAQVTVLLQIFDGHNAVLVQEELAQVGVLGHIINLSDFVI